MEKEKKTQQGEGQLPLHMFSRPTERVDTFSIFFDMTEGADPPSTEPKKVGAKVHLWFLFLLFISTDAEVLATEVDLYIDIYKR